MELHIYEKLIGFDPIRTDNGMPLGVAPIGIEKGDVLRIQFNSDGAREIVQVDRDGQTIWIKSKA